MRPEVEEALSTLQKNGPGAADQALSLLQQTVFSFSMKVCGQREDAEDTMQETLLKAISYLPKFNSPKALGVWLYKVAKNFCLMSRRKSKFAPREHLSVEVLMPDPKGLGRLADAGSTMPDRPLLREESAEQLQKAILKLPPEYRLIVVLHDMEELSTEEVARITGLREGTVRVRLHRARVFLRNELAGARAPLHPATGGRPVRPSRCKELFRELSDYLDGALDPSLCAELEQHLSDCNPCWAFVKSLKRTVERLRHHRPPALTPQRAVKMRAALLAEYQRAMQAAHGERPEASH